MGVACIDTGALEGLARLGFCVEPSPVTDLSALAEQLSLASLHVKRDDLLPAVGGGNKARKLDYLLASQPLRDSPTFESIGGVGSGHLVAMSLAAERLGRRLIAHCFVQPWGPHVEANLALTVSGPTSLRLYRSRLSLALLRCDLLLGLRAPRASFVPPGGTTPLGMVGYVRAGLELGEQIRRGDLPRPQRIYVALGTGGTAVGLVVGLSLADIRTEVRAIAVVERTLATRARLRRLERSVRTWLGEHGIPNAHEASAARLHVDRSQLGRGYGHLTAQSLAACETLAPLGVHLEPVYTGKAMAALERDASDLVGCSVLFWHTARRHDLQPVENWQQRLPRSLSVRLGTGSQSSATASRRGFLVSASVLALGSVAAWHRLGCYGDLPDWRGASLSPREAAIVAAAASALLPPLEPIGLSPLTIAANVDRYLAAFSEPYKDEVHMMLTFVEQATPLGGRFGRLSRLGPKERAAYLSRLAERGGLPALAYRGLRDLCMLGYYQDPRTWPAIGYTGPWVSAAQQRAEGELDPASVGYEKLRAPAGAQPRGSKP